MPTLTGRRRPRVDPGAFDCSGRGLPDGDVLHQVYAKICEKYGLCSLLRTARVWGDSAAITRQRRTNTWPANGREERSVAPSGNNPLFYR
jgi:hypothetical protein